MRAQRKARCICTYEYICRKVFAAQCARKKHTEQHMGTSWLAQEVQFDLAVLWNLRRNGKGKDKQPRRSQKNARKTARIWDLASHLLASERDAPKGKGVSVHDGIDLIPNQNLSPGSLAFHSYRSINRYTRIECPRAWDTILLEPLQHQRYQSTNMRPQNPLHSKLQKSTLQ